MASATSAPASGPVSCAKLAASLTLHQRVGQLLMVGVSSGGLSSRDKRVLAKHQVGSVIFLGNSRAGATRIRRLTRSARAATPRPRQIRTLLAVDQEGGTVQRLRGSGFSTIPSASRQAKMSDARLASSARTWARQLKAVGIDADLAPVADVVPASLVAVNKPIGVLKRGYGPNPYVVARKAGAFVRGMDRAGVASSTKHFPGLGRVRGNTDFTARVVDSSTTRTDPALRGFAGAISAGVDMVMVSSAYYAKIDRNRRAVFSPTVMQQMLRRNLEFGGVIISDDLSARAVLDLSPGQRSVRFLAAGGDLIIVGNAASVSAMTSAVVAQARRSKTFSAAVTAKTARVLTMKARRGLAPCA
jgi:beta-N-acetylhexosaminidase